MANSDRNRVDLNCICRIPLKENGQDERSRGKERLGQRHVNRETPFLPISCNIRIRGRHRRDIRLDRGQSNEHLPLHNDAADWDSNLFSETILGVWNVARDHGT